MKLKDVIHYYIGCLVEQPNYTRHKDEFYTLQSIAYGEDVVYLSLNYYTCKRQLKEIKPILRRLEDMTEEHRAEYDRLLSICYSVNAFKNQVLSDAAITHFLLSNHFDLFGLIESGQATDAKSLTN